MAFDLNDFILAVNDGEPTAPTEENIEFESCEEISKLTEKGGLNVVDAPNNMLKDITSSSIVGFYRFALQEYLRTFPNYKTIDVLPARNLDQEVDYFGPLVVLGRGMIQGEVLGVRGQKNNSISPKPIPGISVQDSKSRTHSLIIPININITVQTLAEAERLGWIIYNFFLAISGDVLTDTLPGLTNATAPSLTPVTPTPKFKDLLELDVDFQTSMKVDTIMKVPENFIKKIYLRVQEIESFDEVVIQ